MRENDPTCIAVHRRFNGARVFLSACLMASDEPPTRADYVSLLFQIMRLLCGGQDLGSVQ